MTAYIKGSNDEMLKYIKILKTFNTIIKKEIESIEVIVENHRIKKIDTQFDSNLEARKVLFDILERYCNSQINTINSLSQLIQEGK